MITDVLIFRYRDMIWGDLPDEHRRTIHQIGTILFEQALPRLKYAHTDGNRVIEYAYHSLCKELGIEDLIDRHGAPYSGITMSLSDACRFFLRERNHQEDVDTSVKKQLSLAELILKEFEYYTQKRDQHALRDRVVNEVNKRAEMNGFPFRYRAGMFHRAVDPLIGREVDDPFWPLLRDPKWANVVTDMKEAIDRRDNSGRDPALYASKALESAIKIISDDRGLTIGSEKGASNYIDNLSSRRGNHFISSWEADLMRKFFGDVRNPLGHGPGSAEMPSLTSEQTDFSIAFCMAWIRSLVRRA